MFEHPYFDIYPYEKVPLDRDIYLRDEIYLQDYEKSFLAMLDGSEWKQVGYVTFVAARKATEHGIELSWFADIFNRFHEVTIILPRDQFVTCVGAWRWDEKPTIFVKSGWIKQLHLRANCVFGMIDAIGVRDAINSGFAFGESLPALRAGLDVIAANFPQISFISFADTLILKGNWTAGYFAENVRNTYNPESIVVLFKEVRELFKKTLGLNVYGIFTQGSNEYSGDSLLHISESKNHICLNSLGAPFADLRQIEAAAKAAYRAKHHERAEMYFDESYYNSLRLDSEFKKTPAKRYSYKTAISESDASYVCASCDEILSHLKSDKS